MNLENDIYVKIGQEAWSIMPEIAKELIVQYEINDIVGGCTIYWFNKKGDRESYSLCDLPNQKLDLIGSLLKELREKTNSNWNHCSFTLFDNAEFKVEFAYVDPEDTWPSLFMKGVSDLSREEVEQTYIPIEYWEERVRIKNSKS